MIEPRAELRGRDTQVRAQKILAEEALELHTNGMLQVRHATHVSNMELRSLSHERLTQILRMRTAYEKELRTILRDGAEAGVFAIDDTGLTAMALIQMMTGVIVWFRPGERLSMAEVTATYLSMTMRLVGANIDGKTGRERHVHEHAQLRA